MAKFRALDKDGNVLGETEAATGAAAIEWALAQYSAKRPRFVPLVVERDDDDGSGWKFVWKGETTTKG